MKYYSFLMNVSFAEMRMIVNECEKRNIRLLACMQQADLWVRYASTEMEITHGDQVMYYMAALGAFDQGRTLTEEDVRLF